MPDILLCRLELLDETDITLDLSKKAFGHQLLEEAFRYVSVREKDYFGLRFENEKGLKEWLDALKPIKKQLRDAAHSFKFLVKFYPSKPSDLQDEATRYLFCLQLRKDLINGRLPCSVDTATLLASLAVQSEFGEYDPLEHDDGYLESFSMLDNEPPEFVERVAKLHATHGKMVPTEADYMFIEECSKLSFYGIHFYNTMLDKKESKGKLGVSHEGISVFEGDLPHLHLKIIHQWFKVTEVFFHRKKLGLTVAVDEKTCTGSSSETFHFRFERESLCKIVWKSIVEHHTFFRRHKPDELPKDSLFNRTMSHRYSGRTQKQVIDDAFLPDGTKKPEAEFARTSSLTRQHFRVAAPRYTSASSLHARAKLAKDVSPVPSPSKLRSPASMCSLGAGNGRALSNGSGSPAYTPSPSSDFEGRASLSAVVL
ncbi:band 4.1-like protein 2 [Sycon ciliatum]|uniref:band 4.1-like protein 2 n=1 Tax=Sycon ciliatum TaxID=27933 RepID=UPI0031F6F5D1